MNAVAQMPSPPSATPSPARALWLAARPATLWASIVPVIVGSAMAHACGQFRVGSFIAATLAAILIQVGTNLFNDYADFAKGADTNQRLGPPRATQRGWLAPTTVLAASLVCFATAIAAGTYLVAQSGWPLVIIGLASVGAGIAYTGGPWPLAYLGLGEPFVFVFFGLIAVAGTYFVQTGTLAAQAWWAAAPIGSLVTAILVVNNLRDRSTDAVARKRTLAVRFGARFARGEYAGLVIVAYLAPLVAWFLGAVRPGWLLPLLSLPWAWRGLRLVGKSDDRALNPALGATARLELLYGLLLAVGVHL